MNKKLSLFYFLVIAFLALTPFLGTVGLSLDKIFQSTDPEHRIFFELRIPRLILCFSAGASLALLGAVYQMIFHNSLAEPYVLGVSTASTLGVFLFEHFLFQFSPLYGQMFAGLLSAVVYSLLLFTLTRKVLRNPERIILFGMGANFFLSSVLFLLISYFQSSVGSNSIRWLFGQVPWLDLKTAVTLFAISAFLSLLLLAQSRKIDILALGDGVAKSMGVDPKITRRNLLILSSILLGLVSSSMGTVGFVGLVAPHAVRLWLKPVKTKDLLIHSLFLGGAFLSLSDAVSRVLIPPVEFPVGVITTFLGGPLFLYLLWKR